MHRLDIIRMIVSPRPSHSLGIPVVRNNVVVISEFFVADRAYAALSPDFRFSSLRISAGERSSRYPRG